MAEETPKTIILSGKPEHHELPAAAGVTISPGMMVERVNGTLRPHSTATESTGRIAIEAREWGKGITDDYAPQEQTKYIICSPGDQVYALLEAGANVTEGDGVVSNGAGAVQGRDATTPEREYDWEAVESVNNTGGAGPVGIRLERI